jgi:hypothetical protein
VQAGSDDSALWIGVLKNEDPLKTHVLYGKYSDQDEDFDVDEVRAYACILAEKCTANSLYLQVALL